MKKSMDGEKFSNHPICFSVRLLLSALGFFASMVMYMQRVDMSVGIVCMINNTHIDMENNAIVLTRNNNEFTTEAYKLDNNTERHCYNSQSESSKSEDGPFSWNKETQGFILSSFFYGYILTQIFGGWLALRFGAKRVLLIAILSTSILTCLIPYSAHLSYKVLIAIRAAIGLFQGLIWPSLNTLWIQWIPPNERGFLIGLANSGSNVGNVITFPLGGILCVNGFGGGWPSIFYLIGFIGLLWCMLWAMLAKDSPSDHRLISFKEKIFLINQTKTELSNQPNKKLKTPWAKLFRSTPLRALVITHTCANFGGYLFLTQLPTYIHEVLHFDIRSNGLLSALPYIAIFLLSMIANVLSDKLIQSNVISRKNCRKLFNTIGFAGPMFAVIGLYFIDCSQPYLAIGLIIAGLGIKGFATGPGYGINFNDIGGDFVGIVFGISNTIGTIPGFLGPYLVGVLTKNKKQEEWAKVFFITAVLYLIGALSFAMFAEGESQNWSSNKKSSANGEDVEQSEEAQKLTRN